MDLLFQDIVDRMRMVTGTGYDSELAKILGITPQALSNFKKKGKMPSDLAIKFALEHKVTVDWLLTGEWDEKSALVVLRQRLQTLATLRPLTGLVADMGMKDNDLRRFIAGTYSPPKDMLLALSKRAGAACREERFLKALGVNDKALEVADEGSVVVIGDMSANGAGDLDDVEELLRSSAKRPKILQVPGNHDVAFFRKSLPAELEAIKRVFEKYAELVEHGENPVVHMEEDELQMIAHPDLWGKVQRLDQSLVRREKRQKKAK